MPVDAIGGVFNAQGASQTSRNAISQDEFIRLFLTQLQFQDPLEPVDNREFLAQLAQFTALEQSRQTSQNTTDLLTMTAANQAVGLINRQVQVNGIGIPFSGTVIAVEFNANGAQLSVRRPSGQVTTGVKLSQVTLVSP